MPRIPDLPAGSSANSTDKIPSDQSGVTRWITVAMISAAVSIGTTQLQNGAVTLEKLADVATDQLLGRDTAGDGPPEALAVGGGVEFTGAGGIRRSALTGAVTAPAGSNTTTLAAEVVGISNVSDGVAGEIPTWDASGEYTTAATGVAGQVFTSNGPGTQPSFQSGAGGYTDEMAQDAVAGMASAAFAYLDSTPSFSFADRDWGDFTSTGGGLLFNLDADSVGNNELAAGAVHSAEISNGEVNDNDLRASNGLSVMGRSATGVGVEGDIIATADGDVLRRSGSTLGFGTIVLGALGNGTALSAVARSANSSGVRADVSATAGQYGALRERGSALSFRRESYQALTASGTGTVTVTFTVATSPNATVDNNVLDDDNMVINFVSPVNGEGGVIIMTNSVGTADSGTFQLNGSVTNVEAFVPEANIDDNDDAINIYRWTYDGTRLLVWLETETRPT